MENEILNAIEKLKCFENISYDLLNEFQNLYEIAKERNNNYCSKCKEWLKMELPTDCFSKPEYCIRTESDSIFIILYEELKR